MIRIQVSTAILNRAIRDFIAGTKKDLVVETQRQAKLLCIALATQAPPKPSGMGGLEASIPKVWGKRIRGQMGTIIKGVRSLGLFALARINDPTVLKNSYYPNKVTPQLRLVTKKYTPAQLRANERKQLRDLRGNKRKKKQASLEKNRGSEFESTGYQVTEVSALHRIMEASKTNPQSALKNLRQLLKNRLQGTVPTIHNNLMGRAVADYYASLNNKAKTRAKGSKMTQKVYINTGDPRQDREQLAAQVERNIGTVKAGWVQAGLAIPVKAGPRLPAWLTGKRPVGQAQVNASGMRTVVSLLNNEGNAGGIDNRTDYVSTALRSRIAKVQTNINEAMKAQARKWHKRAGIPVPASLAPGKAAAAQAATP